MIDFPLNTVLDVAIILLLVPTIIYAVILNRRLSALRNSKDELAKVVSSFNEATMRAEAGIPKLKKATLEANNALQERVEKAHTLRDDLAFMIERAEETADRLEERCEPAVSMKRLRRRPDLRRHLCAKRRKCHCAQRRKPTRWCPRALSRVRH